jgi:hypothetical protein
MSDWHEATSRHTHGSLVLRDILTRGDNYAPAQRGAVRHNRSRTSATFVNINTMFTSWNLAGRAYAPTDGNRKFFVLVARSPGAEGLAPS